MELGLDRLLDTVNAGDERVDERFTRVMELRYFGVFSLEEVAELTGRSLATVK